MPWARTAAGLGLGLGLGQRLLRHPGGAPGPACPRAPGAHPRGEGDQGVRREEDQEGLDLHPEADPGEDGHLGGHAEQDVGQDGDEAPTPPGAEVEAPGHEGQQEPVAEQADQGVLPVDFVRGGQLEQEHQLMGHEPQGAPRILGHEALPLLAQEGLPLGLGALAEVREGDGAHRLVRAHGGVVVLVEVVAQLGGGQDQLPVGGLVAQPPGEHHRQHGAPRHRGETQASPGELGGAPGAPEGEEGAEEEDLRPAERREAGDCAEEQEGEDGAPFHGPEPGHEQPHHQGHIEGLREHLAGVVDEEGVDGGDGPGDDPHRRAYQLPAEDEGARHGEGAQRRLGEADGVHGGAEEGRRAPRGRGGRGRPRRRWGRPTPEDSRRRPRGSPARRPDCARSGRRSGGRPRR